MPHFDMSGVSVFVAMPTHRPLSIHTVTSLLATQETCLRHGIDIKVECRLGHPYVELVRDHLAYLFLCGQWTKLAWIDSDMQWQAETFMRLLALSTKLDVVGGAYVLKSEPVDWRNVGGIEGVVQRNEWGCVTTPTIRFAMGFTVVSRRVMEGLVDAMPKLPAADNGRQRPFGPVQ